MDTTYVTHLFLSILFFAPGVALLVCVGFVGLLMLLEKTVFAEKSDLVGKAIAAASAPAVANAAPGPIVHALSDAVGKKSGKSQRKG